MKRIFLTILAGAAIFSAVLTRPTFATPRVDAATIELRTFNDCPLSTVMTTNNYPALVEITDEMHPACLGFANLHSFSFSEDGGVTPAIFNNNASFSFGADFVMAGAGEGEGGLRISPWFGQFVDGRFMANATTGEIACFGGRLPFYSFTVNHGVNYVKGTTVRMEVTYEPNGLSMADPATIQYRLIQNGTTYDSPVLPFDEGNPAEDPPYGRWGILNDGRAGGYFQVRANTGASLTASWSNIVFTPTDITPCADGATIELRTFNDCPLSILTTMNNYPASVEITDEMNPACLGFANLHSFSFSEDGGMTAAVFNNNASFSFGADFSLDGAGEGEGGLRISPWFGQFVDGRFMANATTGEIACFGGRLPFYSFTVNHGVNYVKGTTVRMEVTYEPNSLSMADPASIQYRLIQNGTTYDSPVLLFDEGNPAEDPPYGLWGILNDSRAGGYFQVRANTGESLTAAWANIAYSSPDCGCVDGEPPMVEVTLGRDALWPPNHKLVEVCATVSASDDCDPAPMVSLVSVTSDEPDNGQGDGNTEDDIEILADDCFNLRAERAGGGDGRKYTITYSVMDASGNETMAMACVTVPHDQRGHAMAAGGFNPAGTAFAGTSTSYSLVIVSNGHFDARGVDPLRAFVGNHLGLVTPIDSYRLDVNGDRREDLALVYETSPTLELVIASDQEARSQNQVALDAPADLVRVQREPVGLHYEAEGIGYLVPDIFRTGQSVPLKDGRQAEDARDGLGGGGNDANLMVLPQGGRVVVEVFNVLGQRIRTVVDQEMSSGEHSIAWDGKDDSGRAAAGGIYFTRITAPGISEVRRALIVTR